MKRAAAYIQEHYVVGDAAKRSIRENILSLVRTKSYRGSRCGELAWDPVFFGGEAKRAAAKHTPCHVRMAA